MLSEPVALGFTRRPRASVFRPFFNCTSATLTGRPLTSAHTSRRRFPRPDWTQRFTDTSASARTCGAGTLGEAGAGGADPPPPPVGAGAVPPPEGVGVV